MREEEKRERTRKEEVNYLPSHHLFFFSFSFQNPPVVFCYKRSDRFIFPFILPSFYPSTMPLSHYFIAKHRKVDFQIHLNIQDITNVPLVSGCYFVKWRLRNASVSNGVTAK